MATAFLWGAYPLSASSSLTLTAALWNAATFWFFGIPAVLAWVFVYRYMPETKGKSLEEIEPTDGPWLQQTTGAASPERRGRPQRRERTTTSRL